MKIGVIGAGAFGTALGDILKNNGHEIIYYDPIITDRFINDLLWDVEMVLLVAPSFAVPSIVPELQTNVPLIVATKGLLSDQIFADFEDVMAISGPGFAHDIKARKDTRLTITDDRLAKLFQADYLHFDKSKDVKGVLMCGALKNVYAIRAGFLKLKEGTPEWDKYIADVTKEMEAILFANGAMRDTVNHFCGIDDLKLTCNLPSRNYEYGLKLADNPEYKPEKTVEGLSALKRIVDGEIIIPDEAIILKDIINMNMSGE
ncbi:hypothetical protein IJS18_00265 [Candidatus Saccharibacteria bacterium]|nr:hypothetical protein [Candidatus Saccharibacteria bacterium]